MELVATPVRGEAVCTDSQGRYRRLAVTEELHSGRAMLIPEQPGVSAGEAEQTAGMILGQPTDHERQQIRQRPAHVREAPTGYHTGHAERTAPDEPRAAYTPGIPLEQRYAAKAAEVGVSVRTDKQSVADLRRHGKAGLASTPRTGRGPQPSADDRWRQTATEVMAEHTGASKPSRTHVTARATAQVIAKYEPAAAPRPNRATAFRVLTDLERAHPLFRLSTTRNRDIAGRPKGVYGKLRPTRPGEYLLIDTTRPDVFALDPLTLTWVQVELTVGMDWYTRCTTGLRLTPVATKAVDVSGVLYQAFRPRPTEANWPRHAAWPAHGIPRTVVIDAATAQLPGPADQMASPPLVPDTLVVDHGKVYVSEHLTSVCRRMSISPQPARLRTGRDKGPIERFFRTIREDLLQALPGYKGPDLYSRGEHVEDEAFFYPG